MQKRYPFSWLLYILALGAALIFLLYQLKQAMFPYAELAWNALGYPYVLDYGEGPLLDQTLRLAQAENIYRNSFAVPPYTISNYPPVFVLLQVPFSALFGPAFWYGRLISLLSALATALFIGLTLHTLTQDWLASAIGGMLLLVFPYTQFWSLFNRVDFLALGLSSAAIFVTIRFHDRRWGIPLAAGLFVASIYTRQTYALAGPFGVFVWLLAARKFRQAVRLALITGGVSALLFLLLNLITRGGFFLNIVTANVNPFFWRTVGERAEALAKHSYSMLVIGGLYLLAERFFKHTRAWTLALPYLLAAAAGAITIGKDGSSVNYLIELAAAMSLTTGAALAWFKARSRWLQVAVILALAFQVQVMADWMRSDYRDQVMSNVHQRVLMAKLLEQIRATDGIVLADEEMGLLPLAGKRLYYQPFEYKMLKEGGQWDQQPFLDALQKHEFAMILWYRPGTWPSIESRWTREMRQVIPIAYQMEQITGYNQVYRPRKER